MNYVPKMGLPEAQAALCFKLRTGWRKQFAPQISYVIQVRLVLSLAGSVAAFLWHRIIYPLLIAVAGSIAGECLSRWHYSNQEVITAPREKLASLREIRP